LKRNTADKPTILIDLNILLDVLLKREPFYETSAGLVAEIESGRAREYLTAHSVTTLYYLIQKGESSAEARATITNLLQFIKIAPVDQSTIEQALSLDYRDFDDAVQMISAVQCTADCLVTRNVKDYQPSLLPVMQPVDFLGTL
jgi:predicted nucleic acid-binding protein